VRRRKGNKDTLLGDNDTPIPSGDGTLALFLAGADRRFYTRMFSLDHERLRQGGKEILQAQDDVGQMLFSASAGITGLRERLKAGKHSRVRLRRQTMPTASSKAKSS
jgi:uncharacterized protein YhaN